MAENMIARGELKPGEGGIRSGRRGGGKSKGKGGSRTSRNSRDRGVDIVVPHSVRPYLDRHRVWGLRNGEGDGRTHTGE